MKARAIFVDYGTRCAVLRVSHNELFVIQLEEPSAVAFADLVSADLTASGIDWMLNLTQERLIRGRVVLQGTSIEDAIAAARSRQVA